MAHVYSHLYGLKTTGLRFFTVYGPWRRHDMAPFLFTKAILNEKPIKVFNHGDLMRDFTYVDGIVGGVNGVLNNAEKLDSYSILNIGNNTPTKLMDFITYLEAACDKKAILEHYPMQDGDVYQTYAYVSSLKSIIGYKLQTNIQDGVSQFVTWYKNYLTFNP